MEGGHIGILLLHFLMSLLLRRLNIYTTVGVKMLHILLSEWQNNDVFKMRLFFSTEEQYCHGQVLGCDPKLKC